VLPCRRAQHDCDGTGGQGPHQLPGQVREGQREEGRHRKGAGGGWGHAYTAGSGASTAQLGCKAVAPAPRALPSRSGLLTIGPRFGGAIDDAARYFKQACDQVGGCGRAPCGAFRPVAMVGGPVSQLAWLSGLVWEP